MKNTEMTLASFTDYSLKAFDTSDFPNFIKKMHTPNFSKQLLYWIFSYMIERRNFTQVDSSNSNILYINCGVPHGSLFRPILFNLCISDMSSILHGKKMYRIC